MRNISGDIIQSDRWNHPASIIFSGSSGTGKTSLALKLVENQHFTEKIENVFYFGLGRNMAQELDWHNILKDISVTYAEGIPSEHFFANIPENSLVVIDDLWTNASSNEHVSNAFKVYSKKQGFSIIIVTQVLFFSYLN